MRAACTSPTHHPLLAHSFEPFAPSGTLASLALLATLLATLSALNQERAWGRSLHLPPTPCLCMRRYVNDLEGSAAVDTESKMIQTWVIETCKAARLNLLPFYASWKFPLTTVTKNTVKALDYPAFKVKASTACGIACTTCCVG